MAERDKIKRIHILVGTKATTVSMDETLFELLQATLEGKKLSVRAWAQGEVDQILSETSSRSPRRGVSLSRRLQARAIRAIAAHRSPVAGAAAEGQRAAPLVAGRATARCTGRRRRSVATPGAVPDTATAADGKGGSEATPPPVGGERGSAERSG